MKKWFKDNQQAIPIIVVLALLAIALFFNPSNFVNLAWYALVALTAVYAWATTMILKENKRTIEEMRQSRLDAVMPSLSLQPGWFNLGGGFSALYLVNSGGVAKGVKIDIRINNPSLNKAFFMTALNKDYMAYLPIDKIDELRSAGGLVEIAVTYKDSYDRFLRTDLSLDFSNLRVEGREVIGQHSELHEITRVLERFERKVK